MRSDGLLHAPLGLWINSASLNDLIVVSSNLGPRGFPLKLPSGGSQDSASHALSSLGDSCPDLLETGSHSCSFLNLVRREERRFQSGAGRYAAVLEAISAASRQRMSMNLRPYQFC
ncbi:hypothetical protein AVEN_128863-1 [Araneus ventricosus]|uniref:Uncharacterized protein n=1 Tax=Araneus ventricosus TaxID=182803 RepID=A0A4Y2WLS7_ARAVE|nr:hypothetical protein AVEN_128863-1 [Araneus ventricosus]